MLRGRLFLALALASCGSSTGAGTTPPPEARTSSATTAAERGSTEDDGEAASTTAAVDEGPPPVLALRGTPGHDGQVTIALENRGTEPARIAPRIVVERETDGGGGGFAPVDGIGALTLRSDCETDAPACVELAPGAALYPPSWLGTRGDAQCACERCTAVPPGRHRFVVTSCGGTHRVEGEPFDVAQAR